MQTIDRAYAERNRVTRQRVQAVVARLSDADLGRQIGYGWTVSGALAHLAFWDRFALACLEKAEREGVFDIPVNAEVLNAAGLADWLALPPREAARLAVAAAEALDRKVESLAPELAEAILKKGHWRRLDRSKHRHEHLDEIERTIAG